MDARRQTLQGEAAEGGGARVPPQEPRVPLGQRVPVQPLTNLAPRREKSWHSRHRCGTMQGRCPHGPTRLPTMATEFGPSHPAEAIPVRPKEKPHTESKRKELPPYAVILHNDEINTFEYVVGVLQRVFK